MVAAPECDRLNDGDSAIVEFRGAWFVHEAATYLFRVDATDVRTRSELAQ